MAQEDVRHDGSSSVLPHLHFHPASPPPPPKPATPPAVGAAPAPAPSAATASPAAPAVTAVPATSESAQLPPISSSSIPASTATSTPTICTLGSSSTLAAPSRAHAPAPAPAPSAAAPPAAAAVAAPSAGATTTPPAVSSTAVSAPTRPSADPQPNGERRGHESRTEADMSSQHQGTPHGHPVSYPGPQSPYPAAAGMPTQYASYPTTSQPGDAYRGSPVASNAMSLPSMRTIDSMPQQPGAHMGHHQMPMNMGMAPVPGGIPFYGHHGMAMSPGYGLPPDALARYQIPHDPRLMGHRGPKKEIKRRTKTGCLTCRKRRIKCDETHPTCNNCKKSKRECLGYDPIFRQQTNNQSGGNNHSGSNNNGNNNNNNNNLQAASSSQPTTPSSVPSSIPVPSSGAGTASLGGRANNSYGNQPSMLPSAYSSHAASQSPTPASSALSYDAGVSAVTPTSIKSEPALRSDSGYDYPTSIDPALQTLPSTTSIHQDGSRPLDQKPLDNGLHLRAKKMKIDEIIGLLGPAPPPQQISHTEDTFNEITKVYHEMYAGGLSAFFETPWFYFVDNGKMVFPRDVALMEHMASFLKILEAVKANDHTQMASSGILETSIVWELARTAYQAPQVPRAAAQSLPPDGDATETRFRVQVVEALLCGDYLDSNPLAFPLEDADVHRTRQFDFWYNLAEFVRRRDNANTPAVVQAREEVLARMRRLLDGRENRDVLYSIAVVRELAPNFDAAYATNLPQHLDETDPKNRLAVASQFILNQSQVAGGTTNVVRRFSDIASRAFVNPGVNVARRA